MSHPTDIAFDSLEVKSVTDVSGHSRVCVNASEAASPLGWRSFQGMEKKKQVVMCS